jgi:plasmid stability protein
MAKLTVRNVPEAIVQTLEVRATRAERSAEAEHRRILEAALSGPAALDSFFANARACRARLPPGTP